ncbi:hypothetical protein C0J52_17988 [Blattella germanica]|nr:hypothetical protein C0J52_17988 [Blattella germanica]
MLKRAEISSVHFSLKWRPIIIMTLRYKSVTSHDRPMLLLQLRRPTTRLVSSKRLPLLYALYVVETTSPLQFANL